MQILPLGRQQFFDNSGALLAGGKVYFYQPGTTTALTTWQDADGTTANANPVILDSAGAAVIWGNTTYRQVVHDASDNLIWDEVVAGSPTYAELAAEDGSSMVGFIGDLPDAVSITVQVKSNEIINVEGYGILQSNADNHDALQQLIDNVSSLRKGGNLYFPHPGGYKTSPITLPYGVILKGDTGSSTPGYLPSANIRRATLVAVSSGAIVTAIDSCCGVVGIDFQGLSKTDNTVDRGFVSNSGASRIVVESCMFNGFGDEAIWIQGLGSYVTKILAVNALLSRTRSQRTGVIRLEGTDNFLDKFEANTSISGIVSSDLYLCALYVGGANNFIGMGVGELSEIGVYCSGVGTRSTFMHTRADRNYGHGFAGQGQFVGCKAADNSKAGDALYSGFTTLGSGGTLWQSCLAYSSGSLTTRHAYGFDASLSEQTALSLRPRRLACVSDGHAYATLKNAAINPALWEVPRGPQRQTLAATPDMDGHTGHQPIGGAVTITDFLNCVDGNEYYIVPNTNATIQNNSNIVTGTGADLSPSNTKVYRFIYTNGKKYFL